MKKNFIIIAIFTLFNLSLSATEGVTVSSSIEKDGTTPAFKFAASEDYYVIYLGDSTKSKYANDVPANNYIYIGPEADQGRNLWVWSNTYSAGSTDGSNSFGISKEYMAWKVNSVGWSGLGYSIAKNNPINMSCVGNNYSLHFAVKSTTAKQSFDFEFIDGNKHEAHIVLGTDAYNDYPAIADFPRDGKWYNIDIPLIYLADQFEYDLSNATAYANVNYFVVLAGGTAGTDIEYDAIFFHGPHAANNPSGIHTINKGQTATDNNMYNLSGMIVDNNYHGIIIKNGKKFLNK
jgi:hypothetical protein